MLRHRRTRRLGRELKLVALATVIAIAWLAIHVRLGRHRVVVVHRRDAASPPVQVQVGSQVEQTRELRASELRILAFESAWPKEASIRVRAEDASGLVSEAECAYLDGLPWVVEVRLVRDGLECKRLGPVLSAF